MTDLNEPRKRVKCRSTFLGRKARQMPEVYQMFEMLMQQEKFVRIVELGTAPGALSLYFALYCIENKMKFYTYDIKDYEKSIVRDLIGFDKYFEKINVFEHIDMISELIQRPGKTLLFCDDGDKPKEFQTFGPALKTGDVIGAHDWSWEIKMEDVADTCNKHNLKAIEIMPRQDEIMFIKLFQKYE